MFRDLDDAEEAFNAVAEKEEELKIIVTKGRVLTPEIISQEIDENEENEKIEKGKIDKELVLSRKCFLFVICLF